MVSVGLSCIHIRCSQCLQDCLKVGSDLELDQRETLGSLLTRTPQRKTASWCICLASDQGATVGGGKRKEGGGRREEGFLGRLPSTPDPFDKRVSPKVNEPKWAISL